MTEHLILVDPRDVPIGIEEKQRAHVTGALHRAFSIFVVNSCGEMLLQRRARDKYHSGGLWTNTCCSHPRPGEETLEAAHRRLRQEMGFDAPLRCVFSFIYRADVGNGLIEHELDHVFLGTFDGEPRPDSREVDRYLWISIPQLVLALRRRPDRFTVWFRVAFDELIARRVLDRQTRHQRDPTAWVRRSAPLIS